MWIGLICMPHRPYGIPVYIRGGLHAGIDSSNIMAGGRRSRRAAAPAVDYAAILAPSTSSSSDSDADPAAAGSDDGDSGTGSGSEKEDKQDGGLQAQAKDGAHKAIRKRQLIDESSSESEGYQAGDQDSKGEEAAQQVLDLGIGLHVSSGRTDHACADANITACCCAQARQWLDA